MAFFKVIITPQIMGVFQKIFCILTFSVRSSVRSTNVPNFIEMQNTWCNFWKKFAHLAWNDRCRVFWGFEQLSSAIGGGVMQLLGQSLGAVLGW